MGVKQLAHLRAKELTSWLGLQSQVEGCGAERPQGPVQKSGGSPMRVRDAGEGRGPWSRGGGPGQG